MKKEQYTWEDFRGIIARLRAPEGCPWDRAQTHESMKGNTIEEAYEVNQAVSDLTATGNPDNLCEELGDLLLQVMLHSQIAEEYGEFTLEDVIDGITRKMIRRHPHVFGGETYESDEERRAAWEAIKSQEKKDAGQQQTVRSELAEVPAAFPALIRSQKVLKKAEKNHLLSFREEDIFKEILESVVKLQQAAASPENKDQLTAKMGEILFAVSKLAALYNIHSEMALTSETEKFIDSNKH